MSPKVDAYIARAKPFAQPILQKLRKLMHRGCPGVEEAMKWGQPFFVYKGTILANMSGFKEHCHFGFWIKAWPRNCATAEKVHYGGSRA
jgi:uncharacterized protein YdhG (YjbR/CyaY superfamily)